MCHLLGFGWDSNKPHSHCASLSSFLVLFSNPLQNLLLTLLLSATLPLNNVVSRRTAMSYDYLFKYIIIGDTGQVLAYPLSFSSRNRVSESDTKFGFFYGTVQVQGNRACSCSSPIRGSNRFMISPLVSSLVLAWSPSILDPLSFRYGIQLVSLCTFFFFFFIISMT